MKNKRLTLSVALLICLAITSLQAQETINATGGNISGTGGSASYSVGQTTYTTHTGTTGLVAHGVQQAFEISVIIGIEETAINLVISAYPNPTNDYLTLEVKDFELSTLSFQLYDLQGKLLQNKKITDNQTNIVMSNLVPAIYFVKIIQSNKVVKSFKIIKK